MKRSAIYKYPTLYRLLMIVLYRRAYFSRFRDLAQFIDDGSSVVDLCCGFGDFYLSALGGKQISYTGIDSSPEFVAWGCERGLNLKQGEIDRLEFPQADYYVMISSLYHFYDRPKVIVNKMLESACKGVLIMEPIKNLTNSKFSFFSRLAKILTNEGRNQNERRFTEMTLQQFMNQYSGQIIKTKKTANGREKLYVLVNKRT